MTHKIRGVRVEEYADYVNKFLQNVGLETWIWRQIVTSQRAHTKYKWPPHATEWNPPWKRSVYATDQIILIDIANSERISPKFKMIFSQLIAVFQCFLMPLVLARRDRTIGVTDNFLVIEMSRNSTTLFQFSKKITQIPISATKFIPNTHAYATFFRCLIRRNRILYFLFSLKKSWPPKTIPLYSYNDVNASLSLPMF